MATQTSWYIVKQADGHCAIKPDTEVLVALNPDDDRPNETTHWGPFDTRQAAITRRVGLIRAGKCQPI